MPLAFDLNDGAATFGPVDLPSANALLSEQHYLGPLRSGARYVFGLTIGGELVAVQLWKAPTARNLPNDGTWLELARWCLTPGAGPNAGSRQHAAFVRWLRTTDAAASVTTLVSYSDPSQGHTGALYRACNWSWSPTWHRLRPPPSGNGSWKPGRSQAVKDRWIFRVRPDPNRGAILHIRDRSVVARVHAGTIELPFPIAKEAIT